MKKEDVIKKLEAIAPPEVVMERHKRRLKVALLSSVRYKKPYATHNLIQNISMIPIKKFLPVGAIALVAIVVVGVLSMGGGAPQIASAQEIVHKSYQEVSGLTPAQREEFAKTIQMNGDPKELLAEAQNAKDLTVITYEQFASQGPDGALPPPPKGDSMDLHTLKFLQFTAENGSKVTLGIDPKTNLPAIVTTFFRNDKPGMPVGEQGSNMIIRGDSSEKGNEMYINGKAYVNGTEVKQ